ncbi:pectate lyase [Sphingomonas sp. CFBP 13720]|uniref:pectate lyase n=1 Tax=Sphingomonas sp. CFBP 13720 TaxID=2775302 RepID=UPI0017823558|nr:pectate lyase [Sphingomonas sp. CFBP 13720]MBD8679414.1 pectate lyase [Sphingomonas sp. CFBP 13720]
MTRIDRRGVLGIAPAGAALLLLPAAAKPQPAPQGWTRTRGGTGGRVLRVTTLASTGAGSLRAALAAKGPRVIEFAVGGIIDLGRESLSIREPFVTIAGETAPTPGITIIRGGISVATHDVVVRHIRVRAGADGAAANSGWEVDGLATTAAHDVIVDQCSFAWATDENLSASGPRFAGGDTVAQWRQHTSRRISFTRNIVAEGLSHSSHAKGEHSKGSLIHDNATEVLIAGNLYAHNYERNPLFKGAAQAACVNNLIYDPGNRCMHYALNEEEWVGHQWIAGELSIVNNVVKGGASTRADLPFLIVEGQGDLNLHAAGNVAQHADGRTMQPVGIISNRQPKIVPQARPVIWPTGLKALPTAGVEAWVLATAGARPWERDAVDRRVVTQVRDGTGRVIDDEGAVGGYAALE